MKKFASFFTNLVLFIAVIVAFHYLYQLLWAWERLWQGLVLFCLLSLPFAQYEVLQLFFDNKIPLNGKLYKDQNRSFKIMWFLSYISALIGVFFLLATFWADAESPVGESPLATWFEWLILITIYGLFLIPMFRCGNKIEKAKQDIELKKEEEKAKKKKASAEKRKLKKNLEKEKLEQELDIKKLCRDTLSHEKPRKVILSKEAWSVENGYITPSMKPRRHIVLDTYDHEIQAVYSPQRVSAFSQASLN